MPEKNSTPRKPPRATPVANGAEYYERMGWPWWIPIIRGGPKDKHPRVRGHHGGDRRRPTPAEFNYWLRAFGKLNIAIVLPRDVIGIDVDAYMPKRGAETLARLQAELGPLPSTPISTSRWPDDKASGIRLYRLPGAFWDVRWPGIAGPDIDIISSRERYVIAPPSIHKSGRQYRWIRDGAPLRGAMSPSNLEYLPPDWCNYLASRAGSRADGSFTAYDGRTHDWMIRYGSGEMCPYMAEMAPKWLASLRVGAAHPALEKIIPGAIMATAEGHTGLNAALWPIRAAFIAEVGARPPSARRRSEPEAVEEWQAICNWAVKKFGGRVAGSDAVCDGLEEFYNE